jgi:hypothetical protein
VNLVRVRAAEWVAGAAGAALFVSLFLTWYGADGSGWEAFAIADVVLAVLAASGPALLAAQATRRSPALPTALSVLSVLAGLAATIVVVVRLLDRPDTLDPALGAWVGLAGAIGLLAGGWWSLHVAQVRGVPAPQVEIRPAPPAEV